MENEDFNSRNVKRKKSHFSAFDIQIRIPESKGSESQPLKTKQETNKQTKPKDFLIAGRENTSYNVSVIKE